MKLGFFTMPLHPLTRNLVETLNEDRELAIIAEKLGFVEGFYGEHLTDRTETITSSLIFIAWLLRETKTIKLGSGTVNLPNHHPARVAGEVAMIDHMSEGRFLFGIGPGGLQSDAEIFGTLDLDRRAMHAEAIDMVLDIWKHNPPYDLKGKFWNISTARTTLAEVGQGYVHKPYQKPHPPIIVTAATPFSDSVSDAAARGWDIISANFLLPLWVKTHWPKYVEGAERVGRKVNPANWRVAKSVFVADDLATARRYATTPGKPYFDYFRLLGSKLAKSGRAHLFKRDLKAPDSSVTTEGIVNDVVIWGTPEKVVDELLAFRDQIGNFGTLLYAGHDWADRKLAVRSMELMAEKVLPAVNKASS
jgi:alkanesulfonate monooxygenase SsuD/methylene tetrahydromethanopterin reductase-like flavin-dependent oxidoreductase (luciferase family)